MLVLVKIATDYIAHNEPKVEEKDLCIRDLGYFSLGNFKEIEERDAFYVSRLKVNVRVYEKNENMERFKDGKVKKQSLYKEIDIEAIMDRLEPGEIMELLEVYLGGDKNYEHGY